MSIPPEKLAALQKKAGRGTIEVEHLLYIAKYGDASNCKDVRSLSSNVPASDSEGGLSPPLLKWADVICVYLATGYKGLVQHSKKHRDATDFAIGVLEELKTTESISALIMIGTTILQHPASNLPLATKFAHAFNRILSFKQAPLLDKTQEARIREFLHKYITAVDSESSRAIGVCALRGVGDVTSINLIKDLPDFNGEWKALKTLAIKQINLICNKQTR